jgi:hypothetical protein
MPQPRGSVAAAMRAGRATARWRSQIANIIEISTHLSPAERRIWTETVLRLIEAVEHLSDCWAELVALADVLSTMRAQRDMRALRYERRVRPRR